MYRGGTPTVRLRFNKPLVNIGVGYVTFYQDLSGQVLDKVFTERDLEECGTVLTLRLSQEDTLKFNADDILRVQVRVRTTGENGTVITSTVARCRVKDILKEGII